MDEIFALVVVLLVIGGVLLVMPIVALVKANSAARAAREIRRELELIQERNRMLEEKVERMVRSEGWAAPDQAAAMTAVEEKPVVPAAVPVERKRATIPPRMPKFVEPERAVEPIAEAVPVAKVPAEGEPVKKVPEVKRPSFSIEQFMGVKMFAWLGGVAMFFGVIFFVKYAFENNLIPPAIRVALGFVTGAGLLVGGLWTHRKEAYRVLAQALCGTGVVVLYGVSFAAHAVYQFEAFSPPVTFGLMSLITAVAFLIAVRLNALVVAVLGMIGGFLSPVLLPSVQDHPFALFSYVALLDIGLLAVSRYHKWSFLTIAAAVGTVVIQLGWFFRFFVSEKYFEGGATLIPMGILLFFCGLFVAGAWWAKRSRADILKPVFAALGMISVSMLVGFSFLSFHGIGARPFLLYAFILALNVAVMGLGVIEPKLALAQMVAALVTFIHLAMWTVGYLEMMPELYSSALVLYLVFGALHASYPVAHRRFLSSGIDPPLGRYSSWFGAVALLMILLSVIVLPEVPLMIWGAVLIADLVVIGLAFAGGAIGPIIGSLVLTLVVAGAWLQRVPRVIESLAPLLVVVVLFGALFAVAGVFLGRRSKSTELGSRFLSGMRSIDVLPVLSGVLPFGLLILAVLQLPLGNPSPVFGVALLLGILLSGLALIGRQFQLVLVALVCTLAVEGVWHVNRFDPDRASLSLIWYLGFYAIFTLFPFVFRKSCDEQVAPWVASALSGVGHFLLIHDLVRRAFSEQLGGMMGLVPVAFAIPTILALLALLKNAKKMDRNRQTQLAWFGGVALFFITLVFPIQFDRQWLTVSWALEGAALVWLFRRIPHPGLKWTGIGLLTVAFARLALNPAVFNVYERSGTAVFNWHLYAFGLAAAAMVLGGRWLPDGQRHLGGVNLRAVLFGFGGVLLFMLLNIQIADFFTDPGNHFIAFQFGGNFARDMAYSIGWGLFSLALLGLGIWLRAAPARYAAIGLLAITLLKLFVHDLSAIDNIYRIGALIGVSIIAFIASFLYQQFFNRSKTQ